MDQDLLMNFENKETDELKKILSENRKDIYKDETFDIIRYILNNRNEKYLSDEKYETIYCTNCGKKISQSVKACPQCGFNPMLENNFCYNCGNAVNNKQVMCVKCGVSLEKESLSKEQSQNDISDSGMEVLSFLIPILGLILYLIWKDNEPIKANKNGKAALLGFIVISVASFILTCSSTLA